MEEYRDNYILYPDIIDKRIVSVDLFNQKIRIDKGHDMIVNLESNLNPPKTDVLNYLNTIRRHPKGAVFGIVTTYACNLSCVYCYEKSYQKQSDMLSAKLSKDICEYIIKYINYYQFNSAKLIFTGGEPTLNMDTILFITRVLFEYFKSVNTKFSFSIVTNGTINISKYFSELKNYGLDLIQISLDGTKEIHNTRRCSNFDAYGKTLNFIEECVKNQIQSVIRTNIDDNNIRCFEGMLNDIRNLDKDFLTLSLYQTEKTICDRKVGENDLSNMNNILKAYSIAKSYGFRISKYNPFSAGCISLVTVGQFIDPNGSIYKCGGMIGHDNEIVGSIYNFQKMIKGIEKYIDQKITNDCIMCKMFPACTGGCIYKKHYTQQCDKKFKLYMYKKIQAGIELYLADKDIIKVINIG